MVPTPLDKLTILERKRKTQDKIETITKNTEIHFFFPSDRHFKNYIQGGLLPGIGTFYRKKHGISLNFEKDP